MKDCLRLKRKQILQKLREHMRIFSIFEEWVCTTEIIKRNCEKPWRRNMKVLIDTNEKIFCVWGGRILNPIINKSGYT